MYPAYAFDICTIEHCIILDAARETFLGHTGWLVAYAVRLTQLWACLMWFFSSFPNPTPALWISFPIKPLCVSWFEQLALRSGSTRYSLREGIWVKRSIFVWLKFAGVLVSHKQIISAVADKLHEDLLIWSKERETIWCFHKKRNSVKGEYWSWWIAVLCLVLVAGDVSFLCDMVLCSWWIEVLCRVLVPCGRRNGLFPFWIQFFNIYLYITMCFSLHGWAIILTDCIG